MKNRFVLRTGLILAAAGLLMAHAAAAGPYIWDQDENRIDDRIESVQLLGYPFSFEGADTTARQRFVVTRTAGDLAYGMYVVYVAIAVLSLAVAGGLRTRLCAGVLCILFTYGHFVDLTNYLNHYWLVTLLTLETSCPK